MNFKYNKYNAKTKRKWIICLLLISILIVVINHILFYAKKHKCKETEKQKENQEEKYDKRLAIIEPLNPLYLKPNFCYPNNFILIHILNTQNDSIHLDWSYSSSFDSSIPHFRRIEIPSYIKYLNKAVQTYPNLFVSNKNRANAFLLNVYDGHRERIAFEPNTHLLNTQTVKPKQFCNKIEIDSPSTILPIFPYPLFAFCKHSNDFSVELLPDIYIERDQGIDKFTKIFQHDKSKGLLPFEKRIQKVVWRGGLNGKTRRIMFDERNSWDPSEEKNSCWLNIEKQPSLSISEMARYQFQLDVDGEVNAWDALRWKLLSGSVIIKLKSYWKQWYYDDLIDGEHYIGINSLQDLVPLIKQLILNPTRAKQIGEAGRNFALERFNYKRTLLDCIFNLTNHMGFPLSSKQKSIFISQNTHPIQYNDNNNNNNERGNKNLKLILNRNPDQNIMRGWISFKGLTSLGRFGNQVMKYIFIKVYAKLYHLKVIIPSWAGSKLFVSVDNHNELISSNFNENISTLQEDQHDFLHQRNFSYSINEPLNSSILKEHELSTLTNQDIAGYFQFHTSHYQFVKNYIFSLFELKLHYQTWLKECWENELSKHGNYLIAIHIRRGDYGSPPFDIAPVIWYINWLQKKLVEVIQSGKTPVIFIATDDHTGVIFDEIENYNFIPSLKNRISFWNTSKLFSHLYKYNHKFPNEIILKNGEFDFYLDYHILRNADSIATSNSTFSITAAMLNIHNQNQNSSLMLNNLELDRFVRPDFVHKKLREFQPWSCMPFEH